MRLSNLATRVLFVLVASPIGWIVVNASVVVVPSDLQRTIFGPESSPMYLGQLLGLLLAVLAVYEYNSMLRVKFERNGFWLSYPWLLLQYYAYFRNDTPSAEISVYFLVLIVAAEAVFWGKKSGRWSRASLFLSGNIILYVSMVSLLDFYQPPFSEVFRSLDAPFMSRLGIVTVLFSIFLCDTAAYFTGKNFGKTHFSSISPNKTLEGAFGGLLTAIAVSTFGWWLWARDEYHLMWGVGMGVLIGIFAQLGDLFASLMKRYFKVKDSSSLIPGHGGVLDRFDSVFFTAPILRLYFWIFSWVHNL